MIQQFHSWVFSKRKQKKTLIREDLCTPMFAPALLTIAKIWKQPNCPSIHECIKNMWHTYTMDSHSAIKKKMKFCHFQQLGWTWRVLCLVK